MKTVNVKFRIIQEGSVIVKVSDDYNEADLRKAAESVYGNDDLYCPNQFEVIDYEEKKLRAW